MSLYTTGELAKQCNVSVRTVQYYDTRGILVPSALSEGGRRLYSEADRDRLKIICFLRDIGLPIDSIRELLQEKEPEKVLSLLLEEQKKLLLKESRETQSKLDKLEELEAGLARTEHFSVESIKDVAHVMENREKLRKLYRILLLVGIPVDILEILALVIGFVKGWWLPFILWVCLDIIVGIILIPYYLNHTAYICPQCHTVFRANKKEAFFAKHTRYTRKLTCPSCAHKGYCVETYGGPESAADAGQSALKTT